MIQVDLTREAAIVGWWQSGARDLVSERGHKKLISDLQQRIYSPSSLCTPPQEIKLKGVPPACDTFSTFMSCGA